MSRYDPNLNTSSSERFQNSRKLFQNNLDRSTSQSTHVSNFSTISNNTTMTTVSSHAYEIAIEEELNEKLESNLSLNSNGSRSVHSQQSHSQQSYYEQTDATNRNFHAHHQSPSPVSLSGRTSSPSTTCANKA